MKKQKFYEVMIDLDNASDNDFEAYLTFNSLSIAREFKDLITGFMMKHNLDCKIEIN